MGQSPPDEARGVYGISVAAELVGTGPQNLRLYETRGLLQPERSDGGTRRYSANDLERIRRIGDLLDAGLNLAGISMVLDLEAANTKLRAEQADKLWLTATSIPAHRKAESAMMNVAGDVPDGAASTPPRPSSSRSRRGATRAR
jgi:MerR family transcriptional regulator/heat shock protein HspR